jgi:hypothetical protein
MRSGGGGGGVGLAYLIGCGAMPMQCTAYNLACHYVRARITYLLMQKKNKKQKLLNQVVFLVLPHEAIQGSYYSNDTISDASAVNYTSRSTSRGDDSKIYLKFCTKDFCKVKTCYCCQLTSQPGLQHVG